MSRGADRSFVDCADVFRQPASPSDVKVALNGQGPDELFGGYKRHGRPL